GKKSRRLEEMATIHWSSRSTSRGDGVRCSRRALLAPDRLAAASRSARQAEQSIRNVTAKIDG
ncbi:TPA: hypothetical protein ACW0VB_007915, partial [Burkholderia contaminans]